MKVGAPTEVVNRLAAAREDFEAQQRSLVRSRDAPKDPELDQFMVTSYRTTHFNFLLIN